jgi:hypothetical protein
MKKLLTIAVLSLALAALMGSSVAMAGAGEVSSSIKTGLSFWVVWAGGSQELYATVRDALPCDSDTTVIFPSEAGTLHLEVAGDTGTVGALILGPRVMWEEATSPDAIQVDLEVEAWWPVLLITGYVASDEFPARYHVAASLS